MNTREKLKLLQELSGLTQTRLAEKLGVSFVAFNNWWTGKAVPRKKSQEIIDSLYNEYTGEKEAPKTVLLAKKKIIVKMSKKHKNLLVYILNNPDIFDQLLLSFTYNTNRIEGSTLSEGETADILFNDRTIPNHSIIEHLEVKNHQFALKHLFDHLRRGGTIDEDLMLKLHSILMNGIRHDAGAFRRHGVRILGSFVPTANHLKIDNLMKKLFADINSKKKDVIGHVSEIHYRFEQVHPFSDGNGRIGRLIMNAMLLKKNCAPSIIKQENKKLYYTYLQKAQLQNDSSLLEEFICDSIMAGFKIMNRQE